MTQPRDGAPGLDQDTDQQLTDTERFVDDLIDPDQPIDQDYTFGDEQDAELDAGYSPPDHARGVNLFGTTAAEQQRGESLDQRLDQELPDPNLAADLAPAAVDEDGVPVAENLDDGEVGTERSGRLVAPDEGLAEDREKDLIADDIGIDAGAASAEEAAVHLIADHSRG
ncbi:MAG: hypothetical protein IPJ14_21320 [Kineosporiaceae bacterium]|nr:hypothetical protein [Kineosporiaceae bacterium]MBK7625128.1 hypothetical protein [Kineosporiaceae bacterium]MBK8076493.1 hypothetical protein [Kineosporiaceae bacterium]